MITQENMADVFRKLSPENQSLLLVCARLAWHAEHKAGKAAVRRPTPRTGKDRKENRRP
jgi:hypothetical protein